MDRHGIKRCAICHGLGTSHYPVCRQDGAWLHFGCYFYHQAMHGWIWNWGWNLKWR